MAREFQRDKLRAMFDAFDADRDGYPYAAGGRGWRGGWRA